MAATDPVIPVLQAWKRELPEALTPYSELAKRVMLLGAQLHREMTAVAEAHGLTLGEYDVLVALRRAGRPYELTPTQLRRELLLSSGGVSNLIRGLSERGLVERHPGSADKRSTNVRLRPAGVRLAERAVRASAQAQVRVLGQLPAEQAHSAAQLLASTHPSTAITTHGHDASAVAASPAAPTTAPNRGLNVTPPSQGNARSSNQIPLPGFEPGLPP